jgi:uncharacterized membrane protein
MKGLWQKIKAAWEFCGSNPDALAQLAHIGWGAALTLAVARHTSSLWSAVGIVLAFAVLKEISEYWTETDETRGSTLKDVGFWAAGIALAVLAGH